MQQNVGGLDRILRIGLGLGLVVVGGAGYAGLVPLAMGPLPQALASVIAVLIGAVLLVTATTRTCPLYSLLGLSSLRRRPSG